MPTIDERSYNPSPLERIQQRLGVTIIAECDESGVAIKALRDDEYEFVSSVEVQALAEATVAALFSDDVTE
jgi:hypothetical protein